MKAAKIKAIRYIYILVGGIPTPLKNMKVSWDDGIPNIWKNRTCSKPPNRLGTVAFDPPKTRSFIPSWLIGSPIFGLRFFPQKTR